MRKVPVEIRLAARTAAAAVMTATVRRGDASSQRDEGRFGAVRPTAATERRAAADVFRSALLYAPVTDDEFAGGHGCFGAVP